MDNFPPAVSRVEHDPAVLAFVKCHVTSFLRWDLLRLLASYGERWTDAAEAARELHKPRDSVEVALLELEQEGVVEARRDGPGSVVFRMDSQEPTTRVVERLVSAARRSQELRQIIVARVVSGERLAS